jgi:hypothetical protein
VTKVGHRLKMSRLATTRCRSHKIYGLVTRKSINTLLNIDAVNLHPSSI